MNEQEKCDWMVYVSCATFNHATYIVDAMNGFTIQETNFPYVCAIIDDASTDGEQEVIKNYLNEHFALEDKSIAQHEDTDDYVLTFARHKTNLNCYFAVLYLKYNHYSIKKSKVPYISQWRENAKYIAVCEGDDYWINPLKLQKQYDFMESHPECSMCFHSHSDLYPSGQTVCILPEKLKGAYTAKDIINIKNNIIGTNTIFYKWQFLKDEGYPEFWRSCPVGDIPLRLYFSTKGLIGFINENMSVYRRVAVGGWTSRKTTLCIRTEHHNAIVNMYKLFDKYTDKKFHRIIYRTIWRIRCLILNDWLKQPIRFLIKRK